MQVEQHEILNGLTKYGYFGINDGSKVHYLLGGIKTKDLDPVKVQIMASPGLRQDYEGCVNLYQDYIAQHAPNQRDYNISQVGLSKKDGGSKHRGGGGVSFSDESQYGYSGIDDGSKVRYLLGGIKTKDLDLVKVQIMASPGLRQDYEGCVNLYQDYIAQHAPTQRDYNVSQVRSSKKDGRGKCHGGGGVSFSDESLTGVKVDNHYYTPKEYASLNPKQKAKLKNVRHKRGHKPSKKKK